MIICHDTNPTEIIALDMRRDAPLSNDDYVGILGNGAILTDS
jgi:hypothetical protein